MRRPRQRLRPLLAAFSGALLALTGCSGQGDESGPDTLAAEVAASLSEKTLDDVPLVPGSGPEVADELAALLEPFADAPVAVSLAQVTEMPEGEGEAAGEDRASALLDWSWELPGGTWEYSSSATLVHQDDEWALSWEPAVLHPDLVPGDTVSLSNGRGARGRILGAGGEPIVADRPVVRYGIDKAQLDPRQAVASARQVATILGVDRKPFVDRVKAYGPKAFVEAVVLRAEEAADVPPAFADVPGAVAIDGELPLAPTRDFALELLGRVGPATAELIEESQGRLAEGDTTGLSGLQARYDDQLAGARSTTVTATGQEGESRSLVTVGGTPGRDLALTLDPAQQTRAEEVLASVSGAASALVAVRPSDGHVLAAATGPGTDGLNVATAGQYAPGSTFKLATALALIRSGTRLTDVVPCPATTVVDGRIFKNYDDYPASQLGPVSLRTAFAQSCNTAFIDSGTRLDEGALAEAAGSLGLGFDRDVGYPAYFGQVPAPEGETELAASQIGQGKVLVSPLGMASAVASVVAGRTVTPVLVPEHQVTGGAPARELAGGEVEQLRTLMRAVVSEGSGSFLSDLPGDVGAKTGTAEWGTPGPDQELPTHTWMVAFRDDLAVAVFVERGESGSGTAGPLLEAFLTS
ncbi:penicillin-binding transpeptidase domain-containing protein [Nocardioides sp. 616]|uniref:penicillin-binding transpeptidase domain-containing protein n=1 Tax=Nocardioides sp. 616 TaxID=2268090 RepID=UPI000CE2BC49|nr:penicillin-binding transpeptidase domain-containing protein [Nocardioides sp. 616]